jgi:hypothetical protein
MTRFSLVFGIVLVTLAAAPGAYAICKSPKNICKHIDDCLQRASEADNKDAVQIKAGVKARNGKMTGVGLETCARDLGREKEWKIWTRGCSDPEYFQIAKVEMELGKTFCDRYAQ